MGGWKQNYPFYRAVILKKKCEEENSQTQPQISTHYHERGASFSISLIVYVIASACAAVPTGVAQPVNIEWAPTAQKISVRVYSGPCARADFQEE